MEQRTKAEAELLQAKKIEALGQVTRGIAHDVNNVLAILRGCLEALSGRQSEDRLQSRVVLALETIERGEKLMAQLLAFARRGPHSAIRVDINDRLRRMTKLFARTVGSAVAIETDLASDLSLVDVDPTDFELAVINLVSNARDAMPGGGLLRIRTANSGPSQKVPGSRAEESSNSKFRTLGLGCRKRWRPARSNRSLPRRSRVTGPVLGLASYIDLPSKPGAWRQSAARSVAAPP